MFKSQTFTKVQTHTSNYLLTISNWYQTGISDLTTSITELPPTPNCALSQYMTLSFSRLRRPKTLTVQQILLVLP